RQVLFVFEAVPDVLHVVVILQRVQQLAHQLELVGVGQAGGGHGHHGQVRRDELVPLGLQRVADGREAVGIGGDLGGVLARVKVLGAGVQGVHHGLVGVLVLQRDVDDALLGEQEAHTAQCAQVAAVLIKIVAQVGGGAVAVVGQGLDHDGHAAGAVALVVDGLVLGLVAALGLFDDALDVVIGHVHPLGLADQVGQLAVGGGIGAAVADRHADLAADLGKDLGAGAVGLFLLALDVVPFAMSRHWGKPPSCMFHKAAPSVRAARRIRLSNQF